jgi:uncharacterized phiE125 gp8 family phage protein
MLVVLPDQITETSAPASEPVTTAEAKSHLRVDTSDDDTDIAAMVTAARQYVELYTGQSFIERTYRADLIDFADDIVLPRGPVLTISSVAYYNTSSPSTLTTWAATNYQLFYNVLKRTYGTAFPAVYPRPDAVQITYTAGYKDHASPRAANVPEAIKQAIKQLVGDMHENREAQVLYPGQLLNNPTAQRLLNPYRVYK